MRAIEIAALLASLGSLLVYGLLVGAFFLGRSRRRATAPPRERPFVSVLKPVAGLDDDLVENLDGFAAIDYPQCEVLIGLASWDDPAAPVVRAWIARQTGARFRLVRTDPDAAANPKVAQLLGLAREASGEVLVVSDANVRVSPEYLDALVADLERIGPGLVSSLFVGEGERTLGAALENLQLGAHVTPAILAAQIVTGNVMAVGKSMAMRRRDLDRLGGFACVASVLAEDHALARAFHAAGMAVGLSSLVVRNRNVSTTVARTLDRHTRWAKLRRALEPAGFAFELLATPMAIAIPLAVLLPGRATFAALAGAMALQTAGAMVLLRALRGAWPPAWWALLEIVRSAMVLLCWLRALASRRVVWRGHELVIGPGSTILPARPSWPTRVAAYARARYVGAPGAG